MPLVKIRFEIANEVQFSRAFETAGEQLKDLSKPFGLMADDFYQTMVNVFEAEGAFEERTKWQDLSPAYARWKERHYPGRKILELTGRMKDSLINRSMSDSVLEITPSEMSVGTRVPYAIFHQTGTPKMPMRKIIELTEAQKLRWVHIAHRFLFDTMNEAARATKRGQ